MAPSMTLKMVAFTPIPSDRQATAIAVNPGFFTSERKAYLRSCAGMMSLYVGDQWRVQHRDPDRRAVESPARGEIVGWERSTTSFTCSHR